MDSDKSSGVLISLQMSTLYLPCDDAYTVATDLKDNFIKNRIILIIVGDYYSLNIIVCSFVYECHPTDVRMKLSHYMVQGYYHIM